ncbi:MAG: hypothetical protein Q7R57_08015 [Dehalococcoidales bacterium]|nr:hypothetical protein [Dehalococcoidales bacterium]
MCKKFLVSLILVITAVVSACASPTTTPSPAKSTETNIAPAMTVSPMSGASGTKIAIYGSGFVKGEKVRVMLNIGGASFAMGTQETGGFATANDYGAFIVKPDGGIPAAAVLKPGVYTLEALGDKGSRASAPLEVIEKK